MSALIEECSARLWAAERNRERIRCLSADHPTLSETDAYAIAACTTQRRGRPQIGYKLGFTSVAMRTQMSIDHPNYGVLTEDMLVAEAGGCIDAQNLVHPLIEPEVALVVGRDMRGPGCTRGSAFAAIDAAMGSLEIVDTRYESYQFTAADNIADNSSSARIVLGPPKSPTQLDDLRLCGVLLWMGGRVMDHGIGGNALGDPLLALAWLVNFLGARGGFVPAGSIIMTGGLTRAYRAVGQQSFMAEFAQLGTVVAAF